MGLPPPPPKERHDLFFVTRSILFLGRVKMHIESYGTEQFSSPLSQGEWVQSDNIVKLDLVSAAVLETRAGPVTKLLS